MDKNFIWYEVNHAKKWEKKNLSLFKKIWLDPQG